MVQLQEVSTRGAPAPVGPYAQAIVCEGWIFASGQIAIDPETGIFLGGSVSDQTERVLRNLTAVLEAAGGALQTVVKTTVFLSDLSDFAVMNAVYAKYFEGHKPARATVQAAALPAGAAVEIEAIARVLAGPVNRTP